MLELNYYLYSIIGVFLAVIGIAFTLYNVFYIRKYNKIQTATQEAILKQSRLIELSHEWNSKDFIAARNNAEILIKNSKGKETDLYDEVSKSEEGMAKWIEISMIAHFFVRLKYIQETNQINGEYAKLEFQEAIEYWIIPLILVYSKDDTEKRLIKALMWIYLYYNPSNPKNLENLA
ncbi:hypothetical protein [Agrobacterium tumefaciens]|uniref:hypothetical protein n=1 Tax=Agrobacterium tumefaciens TaxID=358 RepID=UPI0021D16EAE|nr:hypothetical protein [Agrobacterium tumefaciens]UXS26939.1 hypothetical protein FY153_20990 [Agrobacterium tumefaciens]UXS54562.1 hypothetical protein FY148_17780 [Agrobacterium tumefaciens]UXS65465.1 hypothetical protein FY147_21415 [Agrobacterium tumefaciens]